MHHSTFESLKTIIKFMKTVAYTNDEIPFLLPYLKKEKKKKHPHINSNSTALEVCIN